MKTRRKLLLKSLAIAGMLLVAFLLERRFHLTEVLDSGRMEQYLSSAGPLAPLLFIAVMALTVISPLPTLPLDLLAGRAFGPVLGTFYALVGGTIGSMISFALARWLGRELISRFLDGHINFCTRCSDRLLTKVVFLARLIPVVSFDMVSYGAGLTRMSAGKFGAATFLGMVPLTFLYVSVGPLLSFPPAVAWVGGAIVVAIYFLLPRWIERYDPFGMHRFFQHNDDAQTISPADS